MNLSPAPEKSGKGWKESGGYLLIEALVYIGLLVAVMGIGYLAVDRCIDRSMILRRSLDDLSAGLAVGERWRADVRSSTGSLELSSTNNEAVLVIPRSSGRISYRFAENAIWRRIGTGPWSKILSGVKSAEMVKDARDQVVAYRWEVELERRTKGITQASRIVPMLSFTAVPNSERTP